jgi:hypothetical protein
MSADLPTLASPGRETDSMMQSAQRAAASSPNSSWPARAVCTLCGSRLDQEMLQEIGGMASEMPQTLRWLTVAHLLERFMDDILWRPDFCFAYLDDILVFSHSLEEHEQHLRTLFNQLQQHGILINPAKCVPSIRGHLPRVQGVRRGFPIT